MSTRTPRVTMPARRHTHVAARRPVTIVDEAGRRAVVHAAVPEHVARRIDVGDRHPVVDEPEELGGDATRGRGRMPRCGWRRRRRPCARARADHVALGVRALRADVAGARHDRAVDHERRRPAGGTPRSTRLSVPSSSSAPQRPQFDSDVIIASTSTSGTVVTHLPGARGGGVAEQHAVGAERGDGLVVEAEQLGEHRRRCRPRRDASSAPGAVGASDIRHGALGSVTSSAPSTSAVTTAPRSTAHAVAGTSATRADPPDGQPGGVEHRLDLVDAALAQQRLLQRRRAARPAAARRAAVSTNRSSSISSGQPNERHSVANDLPADRVAGAEAVAVRRREDAPAAWSPTSAAWSPG